jgi:hypothetical protein
VSTKSASHCCLAHEVPASCTDMMSTNAIHCPLLVSPCSVPYLRQPAMQTHGQLLKHWRLAQPCMRWSAMLPMLRRCGLSMLTCHY